MKQNEDNTEQHEGAMKMAKEATKLTAETGNLPARIPEITESSHSGITFTLALRSKQRRRRVATRVVKNETGETGGETWSNVRMTAVATAFRAHSESAQ